MSQAIETIDVSAPISAAYNVWTQFEDFPKFLDEVESITQVSDTLTVWKVKIGAVEREFEAKITEQHPDERVAWTSTGGDVDHGGVVTFHKLSNDETKVTVQLDWEPTGLLEKLGGVLGVDNRAIKKDLRNFKEYVETSEPTSAGWRGEVQN
jgi:uncharacterized membrane protein